MNPIFKKQSNFLMMLMEFGNMISLFNDNNNNNGNYNETLKKFYKNKINILKKIYNKCNIT